MIRNNRSAIAAACPVQPSRKVAHLKELTVDVRVTGTSEMKDLLRKFREELPKTDKTPSATDFERGHTVGWNTAIQHMDIAITNLLRGMERG